jgi:CheY-like chemotaxis protein/nitrogen-specific signal transduction histidine kinase
MNDTDSDKDRAQLIAELQVLRRAKSVAEAACDAKGEFLANMSHEIRTPMTTILGYAENLIDPNLSEEERLEGVHTIRQTGEYLLGLINDILDLSKIESGKLDVERIPCSPVDLANVARSLMEARAKQKGLAFELTCLNQIPETIQSDPTRVKQILINLIGNAIKFTKEGTILFLVSFHGEGEPEGPCLNFLVMDSGVGMTEEQLNRLFVPFSQAEASTARKFGGTGLGLAISKRLAKLLGGDIFVCSEPDWGAAFRVTIPTGPIDGVKMIDDLSVIPHKTESDKPPKSAAIDAKILLAEDTLVNQKLFSLVLTKAGAEVTVVENGKAAVDAAMAAEEGGAPFDVILMDMQMPVLTGWDATRLLRSKGYTRPIIAVTASAMPTDRAKCLEAGCDEYATKPIQRAELLQQIRKYVTAP